MRGTALHCSLGLLLGSLLLTCQRVLLADEITKLRNLSERAYMDKCGCSNERAVLIGVTVTASLDVEQGCRRDGLCSHTANKGLLRPRCAWRERGTIVLVLRMGGFRARIS